MIQTKVEVIKPLGVLDSSQANELRQSIIARIQAGSKLILINLQDVVFIDSSGLGALVMVLKSVKSSGSRLFLCSVGEQPRMLFELTGVDRVFEIFSNQAEFNKALERTPDLFTL
jgi:anti-sigma B factor antagonist